MAFLYVLRLVSRVATAFSKGKPKRKRWNVPPPCTCPGWGQTDTGIRTHTHTHADKRTRESQNRLPEGKSDEIRHDPHVSGWEGRGGGGGGRRARRMRVGGRGEREGGAGGGGGRSADMWCTQPIPVSDLPFSTIHKRVSTKQCYLTCRRGTAGRVWEKALRFTSLPQTPARARGKRRTRKNKKRTRNEHAVESLRESWRSRVDLFPHIVTYRPVFAVFLTDIQSPRDLAIGVLLSPTPFALPSRQDTRQTITFGSTKRSPNWLGSRRFQNTSWSPIYHLPRRLKGRTLTATRILSIAEV